MEPETASRPGGGPTAQPRGDTGRNLLFGILALQNNFISRNDLLAAFAAWVADKTRPLAQLLVEQGILDAARRTLLEALVVEHLKQHGGDTEASLAAVSSLGSVREDLERLGDADLQTSIAAAGTGPDAESTATYNPSYRRAGERFRILRFHREGGLGRVYLAHDEELGRDVALKEIRPDKVASADLRDRFILEAEINGGLEHPGIVPIYSLGNYDDGRPFYAMRFVDGDSLKEAIESYHKEFPRPDPAAVEFRKLLGRFVDVCEAIAFAHSKGVLHRDLKPHNVMLGRYGETLLIDWGLAKATGRRKPPAPEDERESTLVPPSGNDHAPTIGPIGSPSFMSPEQAAGESVSLGPTTDVYGLGAILFALLTGKAPVEGGVINEVLERVRNGSIRLPRSLNPNIPRALEAICLKAMALRPEKRYGSARELADEVERWLADEPVQAYPDPWVHRVARWMRRHRPAVAGLATLLVSATVALAISNILIDIEKGQAEDSRDASDRSNRQALAAFREVSREKERAEQARGDAEGNFRIARKAVDQMLSRVADRRLPFVPQMETLRRDLAEEALGFYKGFLAQRPDDPDVRYATARAYRNVANLGRMMADRFDATLDSYRQAIAMLEGLATQYPVEPKYRDRLAETHNDVGEFLRMNGRLRESLPHYRSTKELAQALHDASPDDPKYQRTLARPLYSLAEVETEVGNYAEARASSRQAVELLTPLARKAQPKDTDPLELALALRDLGVAHAELGEAAEAEDAFKKVIELMKARSQVLPNDPNALYLRGSASSRLGRLLSTDARRLDDADRAHEEAVTLLTRVANENQKTANYQLQLAVARATRGRARASRNDLKAAEVDLGEASTSLEALLMQSPENPEYHHSLGEILGDLGRIAKDRGDHGAATALFEKATKHGENAVKANQENVAYRKVLDRDRASLEKLRGAR
jgi:serine/threonine protein kinase